MSTKIMDRYRDLVSIRQGELYIDSLNAAQWQYALNRWSKAHNQLLRVIEMYGRNFS